MAAGETGDAAGLRTCGHKLGSRLLAIGVSARTVSGRQKPRMNAHGVIGFHVQNAWEITNYYPLRVRCTDGWEGVAGVDRACADVAVEVQDCYGSQK
jgi:hypothetical protein